MQNIDTPKLRSIMSDLGRFDEAEAALIDGLKSVERGSGASKPLPTAPFNHALAALYALTGKPDRALGALNDAATAYRNQPRKLVACEALGAWISALLGRADEANTKLQFVHERLDIDVPDRSAYAESISFLALALQTLGKHAEALDMWTHLLESCPNPAAAQRAWLQIADCRNALGDDTAAVDSWRKVLDFRFVGWCADQARRNLASERL